MGGYQDVFISYGRADSRDFAAKLSDRLTAAGLQTWFDFNDIPFGVDYQKQIDGGIEQSDNFVFIIAPHSINSAYCGLEVELAIKYRKRVIPLLHVEEISYETWQLRYPKGTAADWQTYQEAGKHSSFPNMHPELGKINWIYLREGIDDYETGFQNLLDLIERDRDYVHTHTWLLDRALTWERHHKQTQYLLIGRDRERAESWLHQTFSDRQPPCEPTDLHCEYITESLKNAQNLMTQVFLSYAPSDQNQADALRRVLQRQGITVWHDGADLTASANISQAVRTGIEQADNLVVVVSPASVQSANCRAAISTALELHKRLIPVLVEAVPPANLPDLLQEWQAIDLTQPDASDLYQAGLDQLLKTVATDATYHSEHKQLLVKALKWQRQQQNPAHLLRGYNLRHAETWLKVARDRPQSPPTPLHIQFIETSLEQPPVGALDVFISYSRTDSDFARKLNETLQEQGKTTWFDQESIASGSDFQQEIHRGIEVANHFLFVLSPESVNSPYCDDEVTYAESLGKRILTVLCRDVDAKDLHRVLRPVQWIDFRPQAAEFDASFRELVRVLESDRDHLAAHTQLSLKALEWQAKQRNDSLLLRGTELDTAATWLTNANQKSPPPTALQREYVQISRATQRTDLRRRQILRGALAIAGGIILVSLGFSYSTQQQAQSVIEKAIRAQNAASNSAYDMAAGDINTSLRSLQSSRYFQLLWPWHHNRHQLKAQVIGNFIRDLSSAPAINVAPEHEGIVTTVGYGPDGQRLASASSDGIVKIWTQEGDEISSWQATEDYRFVTDLTFTPDGQNLITVGNDNTAKLWDIASLPSLDAEPELAEPEVVLNGHRAPINRVAISNDGQQIVTASQDDTAKLWTINGQEVATLTSGRNNSPLDVVFNADNTLIATAHPVGRIDLWNNQGVEIDALIADEDPNAIQALAFHPHQPLLAAVTERGTVQLWNTDDRELLSVQTVVIGSNPALNDVKFSHTGNVLAIAAANGEVHILDSLGNSLTTYKSAGNSINALSFSPDDAFLATASDDRTVSLWPLTQNLSQEDFGLYRLAVSLDETTLAVSGDEGAVNLWRNSDQKIPLDTLLADQVLAVDIAEDGTIAIAGKTDETLTNWLPGDRSPRISSHRIQIFNADGQALDSWPARHDGMISDLKFSPDGRTIATVGYDQTLTLWEREGGQEVSRLSHNSPLMRVNWFADNERFITADYDGQAIIWNREGEMQSEVINHGSGILNVVLSPNEQMIATAGEDGVVKLWTVQGEFLRELSSTTKDAEGTEKVVWGLAFSSDSQYLVTTGGDTFIRIWDLSGQIMAEWHGHSGHINDVYFSQTGEWLMTVSTDGYGRKWPFNLELSNLIQQSCELTHTYRTRQAPDPDIEAICRPYSQDQF